jgi:aquaporin Z
MDVLFDHPLVLTIGLVVLGLNLTGLVVLLFRPGEQRKSATQVAGVVRACVAEMLGTFALVFCGILSGIAGPMAQGEPANILAVALGHGLTLTVCVAALGVFSGGHFNPAITLGFISTGRLAISVGVGYLVAQVIGTCSASALISWLFGSAALVPAVPTPIVPVRSAFVLEAITTFLLVLVIFGTAVLPRAPSVLAPVAIGATLTVGILAIGPLTGAALNPARYLGPAFFGGRLEKWLVYLSGPTIGAVMAAVLMQFFHVEEEVARPVQPAAEGDDLKQAA